MVVNRVYGNCSKEKICYTSGITDDVIECLFMGKIEKILGRLNHYELILLSKDPTNVRTHCDKHVVKMIIEYAQLMSTAHRMLDGEEYEEEQNSM